MDGRSMDGMLPQGQTRRLVQTPSRGGVRTYPAGSRPDLGIYPIRPQRMTVEPRSAAVAVTPQSVQLAQTSASPTPPPTPSPSQTPESPKPEPAQPKPVQPTVAKRKIKWSWSRIVGGALIILSVLALGIVAFSAYDTWRQNQNLRETVTAARVATNASSQEGTDETKVTKNDLDSYAVSPDMPRIVRVPKLGVEARVLRMGIKDGRIEAPQSIWDTGWYDGSAKPGESGVSFIDGHVSGPSQPAVFEKLDTLKAGDQISVERGDGTTITYSVKSVETIPLDKVNIRTILASGEKNGLVLMTCGGNYMGNYTYDSRVVVQAARVN